MYNARQSDGPKRITNKGIKVYVRRFCYNLNMLEDESRLRLLKMLDALIFSACSISSTLRLDKYFGKELFLSSTCSCSFLHVVSVTTRRDEMKLRLKKEKPLLACI